MSELATDALRGRDGELAQLRAAFARGARLVTVTGTGGVGKTRLATELARSEKRARWFCDLSRARSAEDLVVAVGKLLEVPMTGPEELDGRVARALASRGQSLLVLDNFEPIVRHAEQLEEWLAAAPELRMLVTSRELLGLEAELALRLGPLSLEEGFALLCDRAPRYARREEESIVAIVRRLSGNPLAIELAAAQLDVLQPRELLARLERKLDLLSATRRDVEERHATLRAAIAWSWDLLASDERSALADCAVFRGGFKIDAAEAVLRPGARSPIEVVRALCRKSLLHVASGRFEMYESVAEYAAQMLGADRQDAERRHTRHYLAQSVGDTAADAGPIDLERTERLAREQDNLLAIHERSVDDAPADACRAALLLNPVLAEYGPFALRNRLLNAAVACARRTEDPELVALALFARGRAATSCSRHLEACADLEEAHALAERIGDCALAARITSARVLSEALSGNPVRARARGVDAAARLAAMGDRWREGRAWADLSTAYRLSLQIDEARAAMRRALEIHTEVGDTRYGAITTFRLAILERDQGNLTGAEALYQRALALSREGRDVRIEAMVLSNLGAIQGDLDRPLAEATMREAVARHRDTGNLGLEAYSLTMLGWLELARGELASAAATLEPCLALIRRSGMRRIEAFALLGMAAQRHSMDLPLEAEAYIQQALVALEACVGEAEIEHNVLSFSAFFALVRGDEAGARASLEKAHACIASLPEERRASAAALGEALEERIHGRPPGVPDAQPLSVEQRFLWRLISSERAEPKLLLEVEARGMWFRLDGAEPVELRRRRAHRLLLLSLARQRLERAGEGASWSELLAAGWPGERILPDAGWARVRSAVRVLRDLGLRDVLTTSGDGYLIDPRWTVRWVGDTT